MRQTSAAARSTINMYRNDNKLRIFERTNVSGCKASNRALASLQYKSTQKLHSPPKRQVEECLISGFLCEFRQRLAHQVGFDPHFSLLIHTNNSIAVLSVTHTPRSLCAGPGSSTR